MQNYYVAIDLKSFYASVECQERGLDPLKTNLVVADNSRTEKTICLAVSPSLKSWGVGGRPRLFEVIQKVKEINNDRRKKTRNYRFTSKSYLDEELRSDPNLELDYIIAPPRMALYMKYSQNIYNVYLKYIAPEDIYVYSIDEVFMDITNYLNTYNMTASELISKMITAVYNTTGITATAGIGTNMYLAKVAMDIVAKHTDPNEIGVRVAELNEKTYRELLWNHEPLTDFWRVGKGYSKKLAARYIFTMGDIARCSIDNEEILYKMFGINAELLIDHAWGYEPCTMEEVKKYKPKNNSLSSGQVLHCPYDYKKARLIVSEMVDLLALDLVDKGLVTNQLILNIGYDIDNTNYNGEVKVDFYGRSVPKPIHGSVNLDYYSSSTELRMNKFLYLYDKIVDKNLLIRRINVTANNLVDEDKVINKPRYEQYDLFTYSDKEVDNIRELEDKEKDIQKIMIDIKRKYGKNAILKGMNLEEGATTRDRNNQIGGHKG